MSRPPHRPVTHLPHTRPWVTAVICWPSLYCEIRVFDFCWKIRKRGWGAVWEWGGGARWGAGWAPRRLGSRDLRWARQLQPAAVRRKHLCLPDRMVVGGLCLRAHGRSRRAQNSCLLQPARWPSRALGLQDTRQAREGRRAGGRRWNMVTPLKPSTGCSPGLSQGLGTGVGRGLHLGSPAARPVAEQTQVPLPLGLPDLPLTPFPQCPGSCYWSMTSTAPACLLCDVEQNAHPLWAL